MFSLDRVAAYTSVALAIIVIPGPSVLFTVGRALTYGRRTAMLTVVGNAVGVYFQAFLVAFGLGALFEHSAALFTVMRLVGAAYLVYLGISAFRHRRQLSDAMDRALDAPAGPTGRRAVRDGIVVGFSNPKAAIFYAAILPQFVNRAAGYIPVQMAVLALINTVVNIVCNGSWGMAAAAASAWLAKTPQRLGLIGAVGGMAMVGIGVALAFNLG